MISFHWRPATASGPPVPLAFTARREERDDDEPERVEAGSGLGWTDAPTWIKFVVILGSFVVWAAITVNDARLGRAPQWWTFAIFLTLVGVLFVPELLKAVFRR